MSDQPQPASPTERQILEPGARVGRFQVEALLGTGGMGEVYRAWDSTLERSVALKALRPGEEREAGAPERFRREALALAQLNHPNVCQVHDWVDGPSGAFIAMELVEGETLDQAAPDLKVKDKLQVVRCVALALEAAHAKGLVHRDLKPSNIMVARERGERGMQVKVLDFGLARIVDPQGQGDFHPTPSAVPSLALFKELEDSERAWHEAHGNTGESPFRRDSSGPHSWDQLTQPGVFMGSPSYASPEQIQGQAAGSSSDVFSLGIVAWELLAGEHPFPGEGRARMRAIVDGSRRNLKVRGLPSGTSDLLRAMLEAHPFKRPTAAKVAETLERLLRPRSVTRWAVGSALGALLLGAGVNSYLGRGVIADLTREHPARLAVLPIVNGTGDPRVDPIAQVMLPEMFEASLRNHPKLQPIDLESLGKARATLRLDPKAPISPSDQERLASALGAQLILSGTLTKDPDGTFKLAYMLSDPKGKVRQAGEARESGGQAAAALPLIRKASVQIFKAVDPIAHTHAELPDVPPQALENYARGTELMERGAFRDAAPLFQAASQAAPDFAPAVLGYARCLSRLVETPPEPVFQWARWAAKAHGDRTYEMRALHHLASYYEKQGRWDAFEAISRDALAQARTLGDTNYEAQILTIRGAAFQQQHNPSQAGAEYQKALALSQSIGDKIGASRILNNLAVLEQERGNFKEAETLFLNALELSRTFGDRGQEAGLMSNLGSLALTQEGALDKAEALFRKALAIRESIGDQAGLTYTLMGLASVAQARGDLDRAEGLERQFLEQARKAQRRPLEALALYNMGELNRASGRRDAARDFYRQSMALHQELKDAVMEAHCLAGEAECLARDGRKVMARTLMDRSLALSSDETPYILRAQAWLARSEGREEDAKALFAKALTEARTHAPEIVGELKDAVR